ncbi:hypothetical protein PR003_g29006 [Phytophthora rubi]|uniref:Uncharacterized protein n=1 Tax=Phytophthora rubi TaxID=129364 RepID=A0A6A4BKZ0_9STRA|nr:hypothetical protein PR003_g29006 [Phytophthora rubi]
MLIDDGGTKKTIWKSIRHAITDIAGRYDTEVLSSKESKDIISEFQAMMIVERLRLEKLHTERKRKIRLEGIDEDQRAQARQKMDKRAFANEGRQNLTDYKRGRISAETFEQLKSKRRSDGARARRRQQAQ